MKRSLLAIALLAAACASPPRPAATTSAAPSSGSPAPANPTLDVVEVRFEGGTVKAEVADDHPERLLGLMNRPSLGRDAGMLFVFEGPTSGGFWMKNTLIPLSIAYMSADGDTLEVLKILDMEPCTTPTCDTYPPGQQYEAALEVDQGWFEEHGVEEGDTAQLIR